MKFGWEKKLVLSLMLLLLAGMLVSGCSKNQPGSTAGKAGDAQSQQPETVPVPTWDQLISNRDSKVPSASEVSGRYTGVMVFTEVKVPQPKEGSSDEQAMEACGYAMLAALKDAPLPTVIDLQVGADGKGTLTMNIQGLSDQDGSKPESTPITYANGKITINEMQDDPDTITTQDISVSFLNKDYKQGLGAKAGEEKAKAKAAQDELTQLKAKLASAPESEKAKLETEIKQKEAIAKMRDTSSIYMEQLSNANATLVFNGSISAQSKDGQMSIKGIITAVNAIVTLPQQ